MLEVTHCNSSGLQVFLAFSLTHLSNVWFSMVIADSAGQKAPPLRTLNEVPIQKYTIVLDLNGVLLHRTFVHNRPDVQRCPGVPCFLNWLRRKANVAFWSSVTPKNLVRLLDIVLEGSSFSARDVVTLSQAACRQSLYRPPTVPNKLFVLKELAMFANFAGLSSLENILSLTAVLLRTS